MYLTFIPLRGGGKISVLESSKSGRVTFTSIKVFITTVLYSTMYNSGLTLRSLYLFTRVLWWKITIATRLKGKEVIENL